MIACIRKAAVVGLVAALSAGCGVPPAQGRPEANGSPELPVIVCGVDGEVPQRWREIHRAEVGGRDRVGVRLVYRAVRGRLLHLTSGIEGEFGEALPVQARPDVMRGDRARLLGLAGGKLWVLAWSGGDRCGLRTATGVGLGRAAFMGLLRRSGIVV